MKLTDKRQSGKDVKQIIAKLNPVLRGWGQLLSDGECRPEVQSTRHVRVPTAGWMDESARRAAAGSSGEVVSRSFCRDGSVSAARDRETPGAGTFQRGLYS